ncbi:ATP-dependent DNA helicase PIF1 isoform X2 [Elgaria multicarinata webbii]|uniref:ATP-dependent DNA helicase PIF1 isoform X2 n=1 Tax=Elgaria multicarinata webbii TaxID=159646 RepID=UPI002FCCC67A
MQPDSESDGRIRCTVAIERLGAVATPNRVLLRDAWVTLGRDEFRELVLQVAATCGPGRAQSFPLRLDEVRLFTRFVKDGKSSIRLGPAGPSHVQLLLSNCPPDRLRRFVQTLRIKFVAAREKVAPVAERARLLSTLPRTFDTVSPVQARDLKQASARQALADVAATPVKGQTGCESRKRVRSEALDGKQVAERQQVKKPWSMCSRATLSQEQSMVLSAVLSGKNVFFTGSAGTGKSFLLKKIVASLPPNSTYATASTGVAACQIGGTTLHAFAGIGSGKAPLHQCIELAQRPGVRQQWLSCRQLIIDEISMVEGEFFDKLEAVARCTEEVTRQLALTATHRVERDGILATRLCTHKDDVELTNARQLQELSGEQRSFKAVDSDPGLVKTLDAQCPVSSVIELKQGAQVMLTKNLDVSRGLVNGARGVVIGFETEGKGLPKVRFLCGITSVVGPERWVLKGPSGIYLSRHQLPLKLAWAISIHKSQGMSLDCAEISLSRVFECGQAYVALSRARSLAGLRVLDFDPKVVRANSYVLQFYRHLRKDQFLSQASLRSYIQADKENGEAT